MTYNFLKPTWLLSISRLQPEFCPGFSSRASEWLWELLWPGRKSVRNRMMRLLPAESLCLFQIIQKPAVSDSFLNFCTDGASQKHSRQLLKTMKGHWPSTDLSIYAWMRIFTRSLWLRHTWQRWNPGRKHSSASERWGLWPEWLLNQTWVESCRQQMPSLSRPESKRSQVLRRRLAKYSLGQKWLKTSLLWCSLMLWPQLTFWAFWLQKKFQKAADGGALPIASISSSCVVTSERPNMKRSKACTTWIGHLIAWVCRLQTTNLDSIAHMVLAIWMETRSASWWFPMEMWLLRKTGQGRVQEWSALASVHPVGFIMCHFGWICWQKLGFKHFDVHRTGMGLSRPCCYDSCQLPIWWFQRTSRPLFLRMERTFAGQYWAYHTGQLRILIHYWLAAPSAQSVSGAFGPVHLVELCGTRIFQALAISAHRKHSLSQKRRSLWTVVRRRNRRTPIWWRSRLRFLSITYTTKHKHIVNSLKHKPWFNTATVLQLLCSVFVSHATSSAKRKCLRLPSSSPAFCFVLACRRAAFMASQTDVQGYSSAVVGQVESVSGEVDEQVQVPRIVVRSRGSEHLSRLISLIWNLGWKPLKSLCPMTCATSQDFRNCSVWLGQDYWDFWIQCLSRRENCRIASSNFEVGTNSWRKTSCCCCARSVWPWVHSFLQRCSCPS